MRVSSCPPARVKRLCLVHHIAHQNLAPQRKAVAGFLSLAERPRPPVARDAAACAPGSGKSPQQNEPKKSLKTSRRSLREPEDSFGLFSRTSLVRFVAAIFPIPGRKLRRHAPQEAVASPLRRETLPRPSVVARGSDERYDVPDKAS